MTGPEEERLVDLRVGEHACWGYSSPEEYEDVLMQFLGEGLKRGERVVCFVEEQRKEPILRALHRAGNDPQDLLAVGRLTLCDAEGAYTLSLIHI